MPNSIPSWAVPLLQLTLGQRILRFLKRVREARRDPNVFVSFCFRDPSGRSLQQSNVHRELQDFLSKNRKALIELPRDHGKSTQVCARLVWELGHDPSLRIKVVCGSEALAVERGRFIREAIERNIQVMTVFPNLRPAHPWSNARLSVERPASVIGPTLTLIGIDAVSTGARADLLVCDDIVDVRALSSRPMRNRVKNNFRNNLMNLLEPDGRCWGLCTPWHRADLNAELKQTSAFPLFRRAIGDDMEPVWPERWTREALHQRKNEIGSASFARAYRLVPLADDDAMIAPNKVQFWVLPPPKDPSQMEEKGVEEIEEPTLRIMAVDPATSADPKADRSAIVVLARYGNEVRCEYAHADHWTLPCLMANIESVDASHKPQMIVFESNGAFGAIADMMIHGRSFGPKIKKVVNSADKGTRIFVFSAAVENGSFRLQGRAGSTGVVGAQQELFDEMTTFPLGEHDDLVDAAAMGTTFLLSYREPRALTP